MHHAATHSHYSHYFRSGQSGKQQAYDKHRRTKRIVLPLAAGGNEAQTFPPRFEWVKLQNGEWQNW